MQDISLHILDIIENSARAEARNIYITVSVNESENTLTIIVLDDGTGMDSETAQNAQNPFYTSKAQRVKKVGLGIPLFKQNAELCEGNFVLNSELGVGTEIKAVFKYDHIDRMPLGNLKDTLLGCLIGHSEVDFHVNLERINSGTDDLIFTLNTNEIRDELGDIPLTYPDVIMYLDSILDEGIKNTQLEEL